MSWRRWILIVALVGAAPVARAQDDGGYGGYEGGGYEGGGYEGGSYDGGDDYMPRRNGHRLMNQIDVELIGFLSSSLSLRYERVLTRYLSVAIHPSWWWGLDDDTSFDFGLALQLRWYPEGRAMHGWYLSPQVGYFQVTGTDQVGFERTDRSYSYELIGGYNWIIARSFSLYFGAGIGYTQSDNQLDADYWHYYPTYALGPFPVFEFGIGVPF